MKSIKNPKKGIFIPLFFLLVVTSSLFSANLILKNDGIMPKKEADKIELMGNELYAKTKVPVFIAAVSELNSTKPIQLIDKITKINGTYILLYFSQKPKAVNIFMSNDAKGLIDKDQILSPLPWRGTIKTMMGPGLGKNDALKDQAALLNGYADIADQVADSKNVKLTNSIGSGTKDSYKILRILFYAIFIIAFLQYLYRKIKG